MPSELSLDVNIRQQLGTLALDAAFQTAAPWTVLFGPSGSGKSTILRAIAGLERPEGRITIGNEVVLDSQDGVFLPPDKRPMRWAAQRAMLFPSKTVRWNLAVGMGWQDIPFQSGRWTDELEVALNHFGLRDLADAFPKELSGGQRQLVSVARAAIGSRGRVLLLDEPFSGLDAGLRDPLIASLRSWHGDAPILSVTHDVGEAFLLGGEVVRIGGGRVLSQGPVATVLAEERVRLLGVLKAGSD